MKTVLLLLFLPVSSAINAGFFDLAEYRRVSYDASIGEDFLWFAPDLDITQVSPSNIDELEKRILSKIPKETEPNYLFLTSKGGQKFACSLPNVDGLTKASEPRSSKNPKIYGDALAASFYVDKCIRLRGNNWWAYILCRGHTVEQVHGEEGQAGYAKNILGIFDGNLVMPPYHESTDDRLLYVEESYTSGTLCDLAEFREPRRTSVRYECDAQLSTNEAYVQSVVEVRPCQYLMTVKVGTLCHFPEFLPVGQANTQKVGCQPYMTQNDIREMLEKAIDEKNKKLALERNVKVAKHNYQMAAERFTALTKCERKLHIPDLVKRINAEMDYRAAHFNLVILNLKSSGEVVTKKMEDSIWKLLETDITGYLHYVDYETIADENRGHLWYYFHEPTWPKNHFPKDIYATAIQNSYIIEVQANLNGDYTFQVDEDEEYIEELKRFLATGVVELKHNLVISAMDIYNDIAERRIQALEGKKYFWLYSLYETLIIKDEDWMDELLDTFSLYPKNGLPLNNYSLYATADLFAEINIDLDFITKHGDEHQQRKRTRSPKRKFIYDTVIAKPASPGVKKNGFEYEISISNETTTLRHLQSIYEVLLSPVYQLLSIQWFQRVYTEKYFHVSPPLEEYMYDDGNVDWKPHMNMAKDMVILIRMLSAGTLHKIKHLIDVQNGHANGELTAKMFIKNWTNVKEDLFKESQNDFDKNVEDVFFNAFHRYGPKAVEESRERLWKKKVERWRTNYWIVDYKLRKESRAIHSLMSDVLAMKDGSDVIHTIGGASKLKKDKMLNDKFMKKIEEMLELSKEELEDLIQEEEEAISETLKSVLDDAESFGWNDMKEILELLGKAGLSKDADVQVRLFDENGNELDDDEIDAVTRNILDDIDSIARFRDLEKAYSAKPSWNSGENKEDKDHEE